MENAADKNELKFSQEQYDMLLRCSEKKDLSEWNNWREANPEEEVLLEGADFRKAHLEDARLQDAKLDFAHLEGAHLLQAHLERARLGMANLGHAEMSAAHLEHAHLNAAHLEYATLIRANLNGAELGHAHLERANLTEARLESANLVVACLDNVQLTRACLQNARLNGTHLEGAKLDQAHLEGANLSGAYLKGASLSRTHLECAEITWARLEHAQLNNAYLQGARLSFSNLVGAELMGAHLESAVFTAAHLQQAVLYNAIVDGATSFSGCYVDRRTDFSNVALGNVRIDPCIKALLEYNERRMNWEHWYKKHKVGQSLARPFWWISDYGRSMGRLLLIFVLLSLLFAGVYCFFGFVDPNYAEPDSTSVGIVKNLFVTEQGLRVKGPEVIVRSVYFSIVTMTTLGFGDIYANDGHYLGYILLTLQVLLGYFLLGALVTRLHILFTAGGPSARFADEKTLLDRFSDYRQQGRQTKTNERTPEE